ncbi:polyketide synthase [Aspergillus luchuensis]|uniref:Polyketide synthase n=1 Tax=Aspergillus kawachii TaxID=1069201 RepID=A0A146EWZ0_ASPKA|nr:polyketide synthase [Aspergillus luchuensis]
MKTTDSTQFLMDELPTRMEKCKATRVELGTQGDILGSNRYGVLVSAWKLERGEDLPIGGLGLLNQRDLGPSPARATSSTST